jgi:hypothetical protein
MPTLSAALRCASSSKPRFAKRAKSPMRRQRTRSSGLRIATARPSAYLSEEQKALRRRLRAHARSLGDKLHPDDTMRTAHL